MGPDLARRTLELIDIPSESRDETAIGVYVREAMPGDAAYDDDTVLLYEPAGPSRVLLAGHVDTVPVQDNRPGRMEDGWVVGLGASDMKGGLAVMVELARAGAPFSYLFFGREELAGSASPLPRFFERRPLDVDLAIVLEPTDNAIQAGCLGNVNAKLVFRGESAHAARPWLGRNAIAEAVRGLAEVVGLRPEPVEVEGLEFVEVVTVTRIAGGIADNVVPDHAEARLNYRYAPSRTPAEAEERLRALLPGGQAPELEVLSNSPPARVAARSPLVGRLREIGGFELQPKQAWTPVAEFSAHGIDAVNLGPGATRYAHRRDERVEISELERTFEALAAFGASV
jgi:succinyl-diaminopimelate desuccinylase